MKVRFVFPHIPRKFLLLTSLLDKLLNTWILMSGIYVANIYSDLDDINVPISIVDFFTLGCLIPLYLLSEILGHLSDRATQYLKNTLSLGAKGQYAFSVISYLPASIIMSLYIFLKGLLSLAFTASSVPVIIVVHLVSQRVASPFLKSMSPGKSTNSAAEMEAADADLLQEKTAIQRLQTFIVIHPQLQKDPFVTLDIQLKTELDSTRKMRTQLLRLPLASTDETDTISQITCHIPYLTEERLKAEDGLVTYLQSLYSLGIATRGDVLERCLDVRPEEKYQALLEATDKIIPFDVMDSYVKPYMLGLSKF